MNERDENRITGLLSEGIKTGVYPGAVLLVALKGEILFLKAAGVLSTAVPKIETKNNSIFDLASLTKPFATTLAVMGLVDMGNIDLDQALGEILPGNVPDDKRKITLRLLLCHSSGLLDWRPYFTELIKHDQDKRKDILRQRILKEPLVYPPGTNVKYSDPGFMLLEWIIEVVSGMKMDELLTKYYYDPLGLEHTFLMQKGAVFNRDEVAAAEDCPWRKKIIRGEVHDENAFALGGYSGHAGLFGCAEELFTILNMLREHFYSERQDFFKPETVQEFFRRQNIFDQSTWALGWDTPSAEGSSAGRYFSPKSVGHLGFTGTSVWMDLDQDTMVIFLTNRVHRTRDNTRIKLFRPRLHNLVMESILGKKS